MNVKLSLVCLTLVVISSVTFANGQSNGLTCVASNALVWESKNGGLYVNDVELLIRGISWSGMEGRDYIVGGLWARPMNEYLDFVQENFNSIKIALSIEMILGNYTPVQSAIETYNPDLIGKTSWELLDIIIDRCAQRGILVSLSQHRMEADQLATPLWYTVNYTEADVYRSWDLLIDRYSNKWNVFSVDLHGEPHAQASWGNNVTEFDWRLAAQRIGNYIANKTNWLIFIQGVESNAVGETKEPHWWGGNLEGVRLAPIILDKMERIVYSPHVYGPNVYNVTQWWDAPNYPDNMPDVWNRHFGFIVNQTGNAVVIGEWGGFYNNIDSVWLDKIAAYMVEQRMPSNYYWLLNPNSVDTGGILGTDWKTVETKKVELLSRIVPWSTNFKIQGNQVCFGNFTNTPSTGQTTTSGGTDDTDSSASNFMIEKLALILAFAFLALYQL